MFFKKKCIFGEKSYKKQFGNDRVILTFSTSIISSFHSRGTLSHCKVILFSCNTSRCYFQTLIKILSSCPKGRSFFTAKDNRPARQRTLVLVGKGQMSLIASDIEPVDIACRSVFLLLKYRRIGF